MKAKCIICNQEVELNPLHEHYDDVAKGKKVSLVCNNCNNKLKNTAKESQNIQHKGKFNKKD